MKTLFIFDDNIEICEVLPEKFANTGCVDLFPLTSNLKLIESVQNILRQRGVEKVVTLNTAQMVNESVNRLRKEIQVWSRDIGNADLGGISTRQAFMIGKDEVSAYWFTLAAEKNPLKSDLFLKIAQCNALESCLNKHNYSHCVISINDRSLRMSVKLMAKVRRFHLLDITKVKIWRCIKDFMTSNKFLAGAAIQALGFLIRAFLWSRYARKILGPLKDKEQFASPLLMVSYFPYLDKACAENGHFVNKYFAPLQKKMEQMRITPSWLLMFVFIEGYSYKDAVQIAKKLRNNGVKLRFIDQALTLGLFVKIILTWFCQLYRFYRFRQRLVELPVHKNIVPAFGRPIIDEIMRTSFCGAPAMQGIYYYYIFSQFCNGLQDSNLCIYLCEMSSWEKALNSAMTNAAPHVLRVGYQHTSVAQNYFFYFTHPDVARRTGRKTDLPLPDLLAVNGKLPYAMLEPSRYPRLEILEALRQIHMNVVASDKSNTKSKKLPVLLIAASYGLKETCAMLLLVLQAFPSAEKLTILLKGHPSCSMANACAELGINPEAHGYRIVEGDIKHFLTQATMVLVSTSAVAIDALAYGCEVIVPVFSDVLNMSPILGNEEFYHLVSNANDLKNVVEMVQQGKSRGEVHKAQEFFRQYWCLDTDLPRWEQLLAEHCAR